MANLILRPGQGWKHLNGSVWEHENGIRIHIGGLSIRTKDGQFISRWSCDNEIQKLIEINAGNKKRGLMAWAMNFAKREDDVRTQQTNSLTLIN